MAAPMGLSSLGSPCCHSRSAFLSFPTSLLSAVTGELHRPISGSATPSARPQAPLKLRRPASAPLVWQPRCRRRRGNPREPQPMNSLQSHVHTTAGPSHRDEHSQCRSSLGAAGHERAAPALTLWSKTSTPTDWAQRDLSTCMREPVTGGVTGVRRNAAMHRPAWRTAAPNMAVMTRQLCQPSPIGGSLVEHLQCSLLT